MSALGRVSVYPGLAAAIIAVSWAAPLIRLTQAPSLAIAFYRLAFSALLISPLAIVRERQTLASLKRRDWLLLATSGLFLALHFATWISSLVLTSVASSVVIVASQPIFAGLLGFLLLRERMAWLSVVGLILAVGGSIIIGMGDLSGGTKPLLGDSLALLGAVLVSGYLLIGRSLRSSLPLLAYIFPVYSFAAIALGGICLATGTSLGPFHSRTWLLFLLLALVPQITGHSLLNWALRHVKTYVVAIAVLGEPIGASILAIILFREAPGSLTFLGGGVILVGVFLAVYADRAGTTTP